MWLGVKAKLGNIVEDESECQQNNFSYFVAQYI